MRNTYISIPFGQGVKQQVPANLLPLPFLTKADNLIIESEGRLRSRPNFRQLSGAMLPSADRIGTPLRLWTRGDQLFVTTDKNTLSYVSSQRRWVDFITRSSDIRRGRRRNMGIKTYSVTQKEQDIEHVAFARWGDKHLVFFYNYTNVNTSPSIIYYKVWSLDDMRVVGGEQELAVASEEVTGLYALWNESSRDEDRGLWLGFSTASNLQALNFNPITGGQSNFWRASPTIKDVRRFVLFKDRIFYVDSEGNNNSVVFNPSATDKASAIDIITGGSLQDTFRGNKAYVRDPSATAKDFSNKTLHDFYDWTGWIYTPSQGLSEAYSCVWSIQTGFFLINQNSRIIAHLYGNFTPYTKANPPRMEYTGGVVQLNGKVYMPILRSGQPEVVNRGAVTDRVVPEGAVGESVLAVFRPLGLELVEIDLTNTDPPEVSRIDNQTLISGSLLSWTDGQSVSEYSFTEQPRLQKTERNDYDKWAYSGLDVTLPQVNELRRDQYAEVNLTFEGRISPYNTEDVVFTASTDGTKIGATKDGDWKSTATVSVRTLRYSTDVADGSISDAYNGVLDRVYYDSSEKALITEFKSAPATLATGKDHPQAIVLNGARYNFQRWVVESGVLKAYFYTEDSLITSGTEYTARIPKADIIVSTSDPARVQTATEDNRQTAISLVEARLRRYTRKRVGSVQGAERSLNTATIRMDTLKRDGTRGALSSDLAEVLGISAQEGEAGITFGSTATDKNLTMPTRQASEITGTGDDVYVVGANRRLVVFNKTTKARQNSKEFSITPASSDYSISGLTILGSDLLVLETSNGGSRQRVAKYSLSSGNRGSVFDITSDRAQVGSDIMANGNLFWILRGSALRAYSVSNGARQAGSDKTLGSAVSHVSSDGTTIFGVGSSSGPVRAFSFSDGSQTNSFTRPGRTQINGIYFDGDIAYLTFHDVATVSAYNGKGKDAISATNLGRLSNTRITGTSADLVGIEETADDKLYVYFGGAKSAYSDSNALDSIIKSLLKSLTWTAGESNYIFDIPSTFSPANTYSDTGNNYVRYEITPFPDALEDIVGENNVTILFTRKATTTYEEIDTIIEPSVMSVLYSAFDEDDMAKDVELADVNRNAQLFLQTDRNESNLFFFADTTFQKIGDQNEYYLATTDNPLTLTPSVFDFADVEANLIYRYPLVEVTPILSQEQALSADVYNYLCRFKWLDENGLEHRSQLSPVVQLISTRPIGAEGNRPTFYVKHLNLTNKRPQSVSIEVYRTQTLSRTFQFLKEVSNNPNTEQSIVVDDVEDSGLGAPLGRDVFLVSSARFVASYRGHFVLWGFPDKPNRVLVSSPRRPFNNHAIGFDRNGTPGDAIELLMESEVVSCQAMDSYLIICCKGGIYSWAVNTTAVSQVEPAPVTGLGDITAIRQSIHITEGVIFDAPEGKGIHLITRGLSWKPIGEPVREVTKDGAVISFVKKESSEDVVILKKENVSDPSQPKVLIYNQRYKQWTSYSDRDLVSAVVWNGKLTALNDKGEIWQEDDNTPSRTRPFTIQTGWVSFNRAYMNFKRVRDIYLLAEFEGLESLTFDLDSDFINGNNAETIQGRVNAGMYELAGMQIPVANLKVFRIQPRNQQVQALRLKITAVARTAKFDSLRFGVDAGQGITGQQGVRGPVTSSA